MIKKIKFLPKLNLTLMILILVVLVNALSYSVIMPLLYPFALKYGLTKQMVGILFATFSFFQLIATPIIGRLSDRFGRKPLLTLSLLGTSVSLFIFALAPSTWVLFLARALDGVTGGNMSVAQAVISDLYPPKKRAKLFGVLGGTWGVSFLIGPVIGGLLSRFGLTTPFFFSAFLALVSALMALLFLPETRGLSKNNTSVSFDRSKVLSFVKNPFVLGLLLVSFISAATTNMLMVALQIIGVDRFSLTPEHLAYLMVVLGLSQIFMQLYGIGWWLRRWPDKVKFLEIGLYLQTFSLFLAGFMFNLWWFVGFLTLFQIGFAPMRPLTAGLLSEEAHDDYQGVALGINQSILSLGRVVGPLLAGFLVSISFKLPLFVSAAISFCLAMVMLVLSRRRNV